PLLPTARKHKSVRSWRDHPTRASVDSGIFIVLRSAQLQWRSPLSSRGSRSKTQRFWIPLGTLAWSASLTGSTPSVFSGSLSAESVYSWLTHVSIGAKRVPWGRPLCLICRFHFWTRPQLTWVRPAGGEVCTFSQHGFAY